MPEDPPVQPDADHDLPTRAEVVEQRTSTIEIEKRGNKTPPPDEPDPAYPNDAAEKTIEQPFVPSMPCTVEVKIPGIPIGQGWTFTIISTPAQLKHLLSELEKLADSSIRAGADDGVSDAPSEGEKTSP